MEDLSEAAVFAGVDESQSKFDVCVVGADASERERRSFEYDGEGIAAAVAWLRDVAAGAIVAIALEQPRGAVVYGFLDAGFAVFSINPKQLDRFRDRFSVAGSKDDRLDARVLGHSLRTDRWAFRHLAADAAWLVQLRELSRLEDELKQEKFRCANRLRALLHGYHTELLSLLPAADEPWFWDLVALAPTPVMAARIRAKQVQKLLNEHRIRRLGPDEVLDRLRRRPLPSGPGVVEASAEHVALLVERLHLVQRQLTHCQSRVATLLEELPGEQQQGQSSEHRDVTILRSLPGAGRYVAGTMLAEAWWLLRSRDYPGLRACAGAAPVTKQSGRLRRVAMRRACNHRLRNAVHFWAWNAALVDPRFAALYHAMRSRGLSHPRAVRGVADRLLKLAVVLLIKGESYDASLREVAA